MPEADRVVLDLSRVRRLLTVVVVVLVGLHVLALPVLTGDPGRALGRIASIVSLDEERAMGTLVSVLLLSSAAALSWFHARHAPAPSRRGWTLLAAALAFVALDEVATIHEGLDQVLFDLTDGDAFLSFLWVIPYGVLALGLLALFVPFLRQLEPPVRNRLLIGGALFVGGAIGVEILGSFALDAYGLFSLQFLALAGVEEGLELTGACVALMGLLRQLGPRVGPLVVVDGHAPIAPMAGSLGDVEAIGP